MSEQPLPPCPACQSVYSYSDGVLLNCPECGHSWDPNAAPAEQAAAVTDSNGNPLSDGDSVVVIKDLKVNVQRERSVNLLLIKRAKNIIAIKPVLKERV